MARFKRTLVALSLIPLLAHTALAHKSPTYQYILERLLEGHHVVNIVDDFLVFWEQAKDKTPGAQRRLWKRMVENKHRDYFDRAVYRTSDPVLRRAMLEEFLIRVPGQVDAIREFNSTITDLRTSPLVDVVILFKARFREYSQQRDIYIGVSMFQFDGAVRPVENESGVPDTLCLGADVLSGYSREQVRIAITHEFFHLYHFNSLFQQPEITASDCRAPHMRLMIEGMAVAGAEEVFPGESRESYLHFTKEEDESQHRDLVEHSRQFLDLIRESAPVEEYSQWFTRSHGGEAPPRGGYLLGYEVARRVMSSFTLEQMIRMTPAELREHSEEQLAVMAEERVLLLASR
ncbi:MAG TPA: DUF2268 domain-containing putative Zn-dependent protease [Blastocatellia bacterium]|nr:DUF2268 domain-containing putative Zn-dependent protease [Blastocatellia bacterium]